VKLKLEIATKTLLFLAFGTVSSVGCGGGTRGTGVGQLYNGYENSFNAEPIKSPNTSIFDDNSDDLDRSKAEPCPLQSSTDTDTCKWQETILRSCLVDSGLKVAEDPKHTPCEIAESLATLVRNKLKIDENIKASAACKNIKELCVAERKEK
jgi:hypothetical protein